MSIENVFYLFLLVVSRNCGDLSLVRVGRKSHIHPSVMKFSLDSLTKEVKERQTIVSAAGDLSSIREKLKIYEHREKELNIEILELENSPFPDNHTKVSLRSLLLCTPNIIKVSFPVIINNYSLKSR